MVSGYSSQIDRQRRQTSCTSGWFQVIACSGPWPNRVGEYAPGLSRSRASLNKLYATSTRKPLTPRSSQKRRVFSKSAATAGSRQFRSGCSGANRRRYHRPSGVRDHAGPPNKDRQLFGGSYEGGAKWERAASGESGSASAAVNHGCGSEVWLGTTSRTTRTTSR